MNETKKFVCLTNIPTPYRVHFYQTLNKQLAARNWSMRTLFQALTEPGRHWTFEREFSFPHTFLRGRTVSLESVQLHLVRGLYRELRRLEPALILVAGSWCQIATVVATEYGRRYSVPTIFWSESHIGSVTHKDFFSNQLRKWVLNRFSCFAVPGKLAKEYILHNVPKASILRLPNTVDEELFSPLARLRSKSQRALRLHNHINPDARVLFTPARLIAMKGIVEYVKAVLCLSPEVIRRTTFLLAGDGPDFDSVRQLISRRPDVDFRMLGHQPHQKVLDYYLAADVFVLPSLGDPNPLAAIEALWAGLPLLLNCGVGNWYEVLEPGKNGWLATTHDLKQKIELAITASTTTIQAMGLESERHASYFKTAAIIDDFLDLVLPRAAPCNA